MNRIYFEKHLEWMKKREKIFKEREFLRLQFNVTIFPRDRTFEQIHLDAKIFEISE